MVKTIRIYRKGDLAAHPVRIIDYHEPDQSDPPAERMMHAANRPRMHIAVNLGPDERAFDHIPTPTELAQAFP